MIFLKLAGSYGFFRTYNRYTFYVFGHGCWSERGGDEKNQTVVEVAQALNMSRSTNYRTIEKRREWVVNFVVFVFFILTLNKKFLLHGV